MVRQPDDALLALLLGNAIGVMLVLSVWEMWLHNAAAHGWPEITIAFAMGALLYQLVQPYIPEFGTHHLLDPEHQHQTELEKVPPLGLRASRTMPGPVIDFVVSCSGRGEGRPPGRCCCSGYRPAEQHALRTAATHSAHWRDRNPPPTPSYPVAVVRA